MSRLPEDKYCPAEIDELQPGASICCGRFATEQIVVGAETYYMCLEHKHQADQFGVEVG